jgi:predicted DNA-binding ribbon-helix-helix protein
VPPSRLINGNIPVEGGRSSMRLEPETWDALSEICDRESIGLGELVRRAERALGTGGRTSAVRVFALAYFREAATDEGHRRVGHGMRMSHSPRPHAHRPTSI